MMWFVLRCFHRVVCRRISLAPCNVVRVSNSLRLYDDSLRNVFSSTDLVITNAISVYDGPALMPPLRFDWLRVWVFSVQSLLACV